MTGAEKLALKQRQFAAEQAAESKRLDAIHANTVAARAVASGVVTRVMTIAEASAALAEIDQEAGPR